MTDPMPTIVDQLYRVRSNKPDHRKIAERLLDKALTTEAGIETLNSLTSQAEVHAIFALADQVAALAAQLEHIHGDIGALPTSPHFAGGRL